MESRTVTQERQDFERRYEAADQDQRERLIEEWAREQRRKRMTVKEAAEEVVSDMFDGR
jgi:hypothetical protein